MAYGLPILHYLLSQPRPSVKAKRRVQALILAPTRELALQVSSHLNMCLYASESPVKSESADAQMPLGNKLKGKGKDDVAEAESTPSGSRAPPHVSIAAIVGGMSAQKQRRILNRGVDILVATPGRLWDILEDVSVVFQCVTAPPLKLLWKQDDQLAREIKTLKFLVLDEADRMIEAGHFAELEHILRLTLRESQFVFHNI